MIERWLETNRRLSARLASRWPYERGGSIGDRYVERAARLAADASPRRIVDVGAGRDTPYVRDVADRSGIEIVGIDVLPADLERNAALDVWIVADVVKDGLPPRAGNAGLLTSRMVVEHVEDLDRFAAEVYEALAPGARTLHLFAGRYSVFAILNRMLPEAAARRVLFYLRPAAQDVCGFVTHYHRTHASGARAAFDRAGFQQVTTDVSYNVSPYFTFFVPLFVVARLWESLLRRLRLRDLGAYVLLSAEKPGAVPDDHEAAVQP